MYDIDTSYIEKGKRVSIILIVAAFIIPFVFIGIAFVMFGPMNDYDGATASTKSEVISYEDDGFTMYTVNYGYTVNGVNYFCRDGYASSDQSDIAPKKQVSIYYRKSNPIACTLEKPSKAYLIVPIIAGIIFFIALLAKGVSFLRETNKTLKTIDHLQQHGTLVQGLKFFTRSQEQALWFYDACIIVVNYTMPTTQETLRLVGNRRIDYIIREQQKTVDLLIDMSNPKLYYLDPSIKRK